MLMRERVSRAYQVPVAGCVGRLRIWSSDPPSLEPAMMPLVPSHAMSYEIQDSRVVTTVLPCRKVRDLPRLLRNREMCGFEVKDMN